MKARKEKQFALESDLCAAFIGVLPDAWTAYAETAGWDILLVRKSDGFQIGIQAKLKLNVAVLTQTLEHSYGRVRGPDCRAILVPSHEFGVEQICNYIGITIIRVWNQSYGYGERRKVSWRFEPELPGPSGVSRYESHHDKWHEWLPTQREIVPEYVPDVVAGSSAPMQLTRWKIGAIKVCLLLAKRGFITRADFKHLGVDHRRWISKGFGWLSIDRDRKVYVVGPSLPDFETQHPKNWEEIKADAEKWMPTSSLAPKSEVLP